MVTCWDDEVREMIIAPDPWLLSCALTCAAVGGDGGRGAHVAPDAQCGGGMLRASSAAMVSLPVSGGLMLIFTDHSPLLARTAGPATNHDTVFVPDSAVGAFTLVVPGFATAYTDS